MVSVAADASGIRCFGFDVVGFALVVGFITGAGVCVSFTNALYKLFADVVDFRGGAKGSLSVSFLWVRLLVSTVGAIFVVLLSVFNIVVVVFRL